MTGLGALTPIGNTAPEFWSGLLEGRIGTDHTTIFDPSPLDVRIAAEVKDFDPLKAIGRDARFMDRFSQFAVVTAREALVDAGLEIDPDDSDRIGIMMNTGGGGIPTLTREVRAYYDRGPNRVSPFFIPMFAPNMAACQVSLSLGIQGPTRGSVAACAAGTQALVDAYWLLQRDEVDVVICGGTEAGMDPVSVAAFGNMKALSRRNDEPQRASRPFDMQRDGFVFGEGCGVLILETEEHARARGARIYCELAGGSMTSDAFHLTAPREDGRGAMRAMHNALTVAGMQPEQIDYLSAHGTSTPLGDRAETAAIRRAFGDHADSLAVSSIKGNVGHLVGAAGAVAAVAAVYAMRDSMVPPTVNYEVPDPACDLDYVPNTPRAMPVRASMVNAFGFGGQNAVAILRQMQSDAS